MSTPEKHDIQQLKSVRDDLCNRFRENDQLLNDLNHLTPSKGNLSAKRRLTKKTEKLTRQITALNKIIPHLEDILKQRT